MIAPGDVRNEFQSLLKPFPEALSLPVDQTNRLE